MARKKTWREKMDAGREPQVETVAKPFAGMKPGMSMLVSTPREVDAAIRRIPEGQALAPADLRLKLAGKHHAETTCPMSLGIFLRIVAEAAWEEIQEGKDPGEVTPFWRVIEPGSPLAGKLTCGAAFVRKMRRAEGLPV